MDPICHTLLGGTLALAQPRRTWGVTATLLVAANLPDIDALSHLWGMDASLYYRRGWTHGVLALVVLPWVLTGVMVGVARWRGIDSVDPRRLLALAYVGVVSHPVLDWLNTYGMRWLMPFDDRWFYADALFIVDPWLWLLLGGLVWMGFRWRRFAVASWALLAFASSLVVLVPSFVPIGAKAAWGLGLVGLLGWRRSAGPLVGRRAERLAVGGLVLSATYMLVMGVATWVVREASLERAPATVEEVYVGPLPVNPVQRDVLWIEADRYRPLVSSPVLPHPAFPAPIAVASGDPRAETAWSARCVRGMRGWARYPFFVVEEADDGSALVHILDARYHRSVGGGFGSARVRIDRAGAVVGCE